MQIKIGQQSRNAIDLFQKSKAKSIVDNLFTYDNIVQSKRNQMNFEQLLFDK